MPVIRGVQPRDFYAFVEFSYTELTKLKKALDMTSIEYSGKEKEEQEAKDYFMNDFYPCISQLVEDMKKYVT